MNSNIYEWPNPIELQKQLDHLLEFYNQTDHKFINRIVCCVCGRFFITTEPKSFVHPHALLFKNKNTLSSDQIYDILPGNEHLFEYKQFPQLNAMVLDLDGFNNNNTVNLKRKILKEF